MAPPPDDASIEPDPAHEAPCAPPATARARGGAAEFARADGERGNLVGGSGLYELLIESVRDYAIFMLDPQGNVATWNEGAQRIKGYSVDDITGRHFSTFYPPEDVEAGKPAWELEVAQREGRFEDEGWRVRKDGSQFWANVVITALRDRHDALVGFAKVTRDLTERRRIEERTIADARRVAAAEAASRAKSEFLATLSHELRTPLNAIAGYADLMRLEVGGPISAQHREYLERICASQKHLLGIINDLLNYSRLESGAVTYDMRPASLDAVVERVLPMVMPQAVTKGITIAHDRSGSGALAVADQQKVEQIVLNLLSNAVKFTPAGGRVTVSTRVSEDRALVSVSDTGPGIPPDQQSAIFEPFVQLGRTLTTHQEGTGLGLAISRDLARAMEGELLLESSPGEGARFTLTLRSAESTREHGVDQRTS